MQEIDIRTGRVLFQWNSADHVPYSASEQPLPASASTPWDWFHVNAVHLDSHGNLLIDARDTWATYDVSQRTGKILWTLGGKQSTFAVRAAPGQVLDSVGEIFAWQHDPDQVGPQTYTWFDDESSGTPLLPVSRAVTVRLDFRSRTATLVASDNQPEGLVASSQGNAQTTATGDLFVAGGTCPTSRSSARPAAAVQRRAARRSEQLPRLPAALGGQVAQAAAAQPGASAVCWQRGGCPRPGRQDAASLGSRRPAGGEFPLCTLAAAETLGAAARRRPARIATGKGSVSVSHSVSHPGGGVVARAAPARR